MRSSPATFSCALAAMAATSCFSITGPLGARPDLPVVQRITIEHLHSPVDVITDVDGRPHIYATNIEDAMRVEGWFVARDRMLQLEYFRRVSEGRLAELLGDLSPAAIDSDIVFRTIGLARVAKVQYNALPAGGETKAALEAYADGITQVFRKVRSGEIAPPPGAIGFPTTAFTDWSAIDSLSIARLQTYLLSYSGDRDIRNQGFFNAARSTFTATDPDPAVRKRAGLERELSRFAPIDPTATLTGYPTSLSVPPQQAAAVHRPAPRTAARAPDVSSAQGYLAAMERLRQTLNPDGFGSNAWAIAASRSKTKHALIASDPHLALNAPATFWPVSIEVAVPPGSGGRGLKVAGIDFPGIPGIILGHNEHIGWGSTVAVYDVSDDYAETLTPDGASVIWKGNPVALETVDEVIQIKNGAPYTYHVKIVPHHGPILPAILPDHTVAPPNPATGAISTRWTGLEPTTEIDAILGLLHANNVDEARAALEVYGAGAQDWIIGDTSGSILWTSHANIPVRDPNAFAWNAKTFTGTLPCLVEPGDGSAEWKGFLASGLVPGAKNPQVGYLVNANNDPIGDALDNDPTNGKLPDGTPMFLACAWDIGLRAGRIRALIDAHPGPLSVEDLQSMQGDTRSALGAEFTPALLDAIDRAQAERTTPGTHPDLATVVKDPAYNPATIAAVRALLDSWGKDAGYAAAAGIDLDTNQPKAATGRDAGEVKASQATLVFNAWLVRFQARVFDDELSRMGQTGLDSETRIRTLHHMMTADPTTLATFDPATGDSALWDDINTPQIESRHDRMVRALLDALAGLTKLAGSDIATYRWGAQHTIRFNALIPLWTNLSIPAPNDATFAAGFPRHGDSFGVDFSDYPFPLLGQDLGFSYTGGSGPAQRFVVDLDPSGPRAFNAVPGGNVWDPRDPHFRDEAELWRKNQTHAVPFLLPDVIAAMQSRTVVTPP